MTILVTGGTGPIGRAVIQLLLDKGVRLRVVSRRPHRALEYFDDRVTAFEWHPRTQGLPALAADGVERIIHLMGEPLLGPIPRARRARIQSSRSDGTQLIAEALDRPIHLIVASSALVYGLSAGPPVTESSAVRPPKDKLARALIACEEATEVVRASGSVVTQVRLGHVIGEAEGGLVDALMRLHRRGITWRDAPADAAVPAIDAVDAAALISHLALSRPISGPVHAVAPTPLASIDLKRELQKGSGRKRFAALPRLALKPHLGALADSLYHRQQIVPQRALDAGFAFRHPDPIDSIRAALQRPAAETATTGRLALLKSMFARASGRTSS
jgi:NAD dependent epimerase/dehydratase family enzyme